MERVFDVIGGFVRAVREVNRKYKTPQIKMTPLVSASLLVLRLYLLATIGILAIKFVMTVLGR